MKNQQGLGYFKDGFSQDLPPLFISITSEGVVGFDTNSSPRRDCNVSIEMSFRLYFNYKFFEKFPGYESVQCFCEILRPKNL